MVGGVERVQRKYRQKKIKNLFRDECKLGIDAKSNTSARKRKKKKEKKIHQMN